jgi:hypothetical protein
VFGASLANKAYGQPGEAVTAGQSGNRHPGDRDAVIMVAQVSGRTELPDVDRILASDPPLTVLQLTKPVTSPIQVLAKIVSGAKLGEVSYMVNFFDFEKMKLTEAFTTLSENMSCIASHDYILEETRDAPLDGSSGTILVLRIPGVKPQAGTKEQQHREPGGRNDPYRFALKDATARPAPQRTDVYMLKLSPRSEEHVLVSSFIGMLTYMGCGVEAPAEPPPPDVGLSEFVMAVESGDPERIKQTFLQSQVYLDDQVICEMRALYAGYHYVITDKTLHGDGGEATLRTDRLLLGEVVGKSTFYLTREGEADWKIRKVE